MDLMTRKMSVKKLKKKKTLAAWTIEVRKKGEKRGSEQTSLKLEESE
jgi:hypothetical protein